MSDAACGPSNSLQQFKQQTQLDRTLQQDRLTNRNSPAQGFRSADPNAGLLDPEFEAFQAGLPPPHFQSLQPQHHPTPPPFQQQPYPEPSQGASWASDFQRMSLASPPPLQQQHHNLAPNTSNWARDFRSNITQNAPRAQNSSPSPFAFQQRARYGMGGYQNNFAQPAFSPAMQSKGKEPVAEQFDEAAFERAFDMAKEDMMADSAPQLSELGKHEQETIAGHNAPSEAMNSILEKHEAEARLAERSEESHQVNNNDVQDYAAEPLERLGPRDPAPLQETTGETQQEKAPSTREDDDALAATAQELLEKVENNQTDKFRNSQFLGLMRKLRDREVKVEGDKMVETQTISTTASNSTSTADLPLKFDNTEQRPSPIPPQEQDHDAHRHPPPPDGTDVVNLLSQPGLPAGPHSDPPSLAPDSSPSNLNLGEEDMERRRLGDLWRSMLPSDSPRGLDPRTHSAGAEESGFASPAFTA